MFPVIAYYKINSSCSLFAQKRILKLDKNNVLSTYNIIYGFCNALNALDHTKNGDREQRLHLRFTVVVVFFFGVYGEEFSRSVKNVLPLRRSLPIIQRWQISSRYGQYCSYGRFLANKMVRVQGKRFVRVRARMGLSKHLSGSFFGH